MAFLQDNSVLFSIYVIYDLIYYLYEITLTSRSHTNKYFSRSKITIFRILINPLVQTRQELLLVYNCIIIIYVVLQNPLYIWNYYAVMIYTGKFINLFYKVVRHIEQAECVWIILNSHLIEYRNCASRIIKQRLYLT